jgi:hypothetical protein
VDGNVVSLIAYYFKIAWYIRPLVLGLELYLMINPRVLDSPLGITLDETKGLRRLVLAATPTTLDMDILWFEIILVTEGEPAILVPNRHALVHTVVPTLKSWDSTFRGVAKLGGELPLHLEPIHLLVVPRIYDTVSKCDKAC